jgi:hypothetical protein
MVDPHGGRVSVESLWRGIKIIRFLYFLFIIFCFLVTADTPLKLLEPGNRC